MPRSPICLRVARLLPQELTTADGVLAGGDVNFAISTSAIAWDPASNSWSNLTNMVQARDYLGGATAGQSFYAVAGNSAPGTPTNGNQHVHRNLHYNDTNTKSDTNSDSDGYGTNFNANGHPYGNADCK